MQEGREPGDLPHGDMAGFQAAEVEEASYEGREDFLRDRIVGVLIQAPCSL